MFCYGIYAMSYWSIVDVALRSSTIAVVRQPDIHVGGLMFYHVFFLSSSFFRQLYSLRSLNGTQPKPATCSKVSAIWKCMSEMWGIPSSYKSGAQKPPFSTISQLKGNLTAYIFGIKQDIHKRARALQNTKSSTSPQNDMNFGPQTASDWTWVFTHLPQILHSTSLPGFADGDQQMELNQTLPNGGR